MRSFLRPAAFAAGLALTAGAAQAMTVVQYRQLNSGPSIRLVNGSAGSYQLSTIGSGQNVRVTLFDPMNSSVSAAVDGVFRFNATGTGGVEQAFGAAVQDFNSGSFSLTSATPLSFLGATGTNVLTANFTGGVLVGELRGRAPTFSVSVPTSAFTSFSSDFFSPERYRLTNFSLAMSDTNRGLRLQNGRIGNFTASSVGTFGASAVPEPTTWALMIAGFGMVGFAARRRRLEATTA